MSEDISEEYFFERLSELFAEGKYSEIRRFTIERVKKTPDEELKIITSNFLNSVRRSQEHKEENELSEAISQYESGEKAEAFYYFTQLEKKYPENVSVHLWLGYIHDERREYDEAVTQLERARDLLSPDSEKLPDILEQLYNYQDKSGDASLAIDTIISLANVQGWNESLIGDVGNLYYTTNRFQEGVDLFQRISIETDNRDIEVLCFQWLSSFLEELQEYERSGYYLERVLEREPDSLEALQRLKDIFKLQGKYREAITILRKILTLPVLNKVLQNDSYLDILGMLEILGDHEEMLKVCDEINQNSLNNVQKQWDLIFQYRALDSLGRKIEAFSCLSVFMKDFSVEFESLIWPMNDMAWYLMNSGEYEKALPFLEKCMKRLPSNKIAVVSLGKCLDCIEGKREEASKVWQRILEIFSPSSHWHEEAKKRLEKK